MKVDVDKIPDYRRVVKQPIDSPLHTYITILISQRKLSQTFLAEVCGVSPAMVNQVIKGTRKSEALQETIAQILGFRSWNALFCAAYEFQERMVAPGFKMKEVPRV